MLNKKYIFIFFLCFIAMLSSTASRAEIILHTSLESFRLEVGKTDALITNSVGIAQADEVNNPPPNNNNVGNTLTFSSANTPFSFTFTVRTLQASANFTFNDIEPPAAILPSFINALSVGDIDNQENDNWELNLAGSSFVSALGFVVRDNNFQNGASDSATRETLEVKSNTGSTLATFNLSALSLGAPGEQFLGVVATEGERIGAVIFNEDNGADDIAIADFRFPVSTESVATDMNRTRLSASAIVTLDNRLLISGGFPNSDRATRATETLDLNTGIYEVVGDMNTGRWFHSLTMLANGNILALGGLDRDFRELNSAEIFDLNTNTWIAVPSMSVARSGHTATRLQDGRVLVVGGGFGAASYDLYDPESNTWNGAQALDVGRTSHSAAMDNGGRVWVTGGSGFSAKTSYYNPDNDTWTAGPDLNTGRSRHIATTLTDGRIAVVGNLRDPSSGTCNGELEILDTRTLSLATSWDNSLSSPTITKCSATGGLVGGLLADGRLFAAQLKREPNSQSEIEVYDQEYDRWSIRLTNFIDGARLDGLITLPTGKLIAVNNLEPVITNLVHPNVRSVGEFNLSRQSMSVATYSESDNNFTSGNILIAGGGVSQHESLAIDRLRNSSLSPNVCRSNCPKNGQDPGRNPFTGVGIVGIAQTENRPATIVQAGGLAANGIRGEIFEFSPNASSPSPPEGEGDGWNIAPAALKIPRYFHRMHALNDGRILIFGGLPEAANDSAEIYDPRNDSVRSAGKLNFSRKENFDSVLLSDGRVMVAGGLDFNATAEIYDPATNKWTPTAPFTVPRNGVRLTILLDGQVMAAGGFTGQRSDVVELYNSESNQWTQTTSMLSNRINFSLTTLANGLVVAAGGNSNSFANSTEIFDPITQRWTIGPLLAFDSQSHTAVSMGDNSFAIFGGLTASQGKIQVFEWNKNVLSGVVRIDQESPQPDDGRAFSVEAIPQSAQGGTTKDSSASAPQLFMRRVDSGASELLIPELGSSWLEMENFVVSAEKIPPGLVWVSGTWNGSPFQPRMLTFPYDPVDANLCFPIVTTNDRIAIICI